MIRIKPRFQAALKTKIVLSDEFFREVTSHAIPTDLEAAEVLSSSPAALDLFMWLSYRCFTAKGLERIPILGGFGLASQLGNSDYARPRKFRERLEGWLDLVRVLWPGCTAAINRRRPHANYQLPVHRKLASAPATPLMVKAACL